MKITVHLLALGLIAGSLNLMAFSEEKTPTPPDFSYNFLNIPLSTAEPLAETPKADPLPLPDLSKNYSQLNPAPVKTTPIANEPKVEVLPEAKPDAVKAVKAEEPKPTAPKSEPVAIPVEAPKTAAVVTPGVIDTTVGTGFSSILNEEGDTVKVFLNTATTLPTGQTLPAGTQLTGKIEAIKRNKKNAAQDVKLVFTQAIPPLSTPIAIQATPDTPDGLITPGNDVIGIRETHSYESLKADLIKTLGADRAVYNQQLKVNSAQTGDYRKDAFITKFHKNAVLAGSGDQLRLKFTP